MDSDIDININDVNNTHADVSVNADVDVEVHGGRHLGVGRLFGRELLDEVAQVAAELRKDLAAAKPRRRAAHAEREGLSGRQECQEEGTRLRKHVCGTKACSAVLWAVLEWRWTTSSR